MQLTLFFTQSFLSDYLIIAVITIIVSLIAHLINIVNKNHHVIQYFFYSNNYKFKKKSCELLENINFLITNIGIINYVKENILLPQMLELPIISVTPNIFILEKSCSNEIQNNQDANRSDTLCIQSIENQNDNDITPSPDCPDKQTNVLKESIYKYEDVTVYEIYEAQIIDTEIILNDINVLLTDIVLELPASEENIGVMSGQCGCRCK